MKKSLKMISAILLVVILTLSLAACNSGNSGGSYGGANDSAAGGSAANPGSTSGSGALGTIPEGGIDNPAAKLIKIATATVSTASYDDFIKSLYEKITAYSGYTDSERFSGGDGNRYAYIVIRIPAARLEEFKSELSNLGTLTYYSANKQDITLDYETLTAEIETLTAEVAIVEELFTAAKATGDLDKIASIEQRLTDIKLRIAEAEAKKRVYDNSLAYSTVNLSINEVEQEPIPEEKKTAFQRIGENLDSNFKGIGVFFEECFVLVASSIPFLLLFGAATVIVLLPVVIALIIVLRKIKKVKKPKATDNNKTE